ncbi:Tn3 family transposase [Serratia symbiotica]|nr:Tn3 family transposase [Serratia symbiotica]QTP15849.1 Tn3 family transposase [Serratia symbiotica]
MESWHQLRSAIARVSGKKEMTGQNDIELEISNQGGRLLNIIIIYYNSALLSHLSPLGWEHIILTGDYHIG